MSKTNCLPETSTSLCTLYERLRKQVLEPSRSFGQAYGLGVLMIRGMAAWMEASLAAGLPDERTDTPCIGEMRPDKSVVYRGLSVILAKVIIGRCQLEV